MIAELGRQAGLTARYGIEGIAQAAEIVTEPVRFVTDHAARAMGFSGGKPLGEVASGFADTLGLPKPENATERVVGDINRFAAGGAGMAGAARGVARAVAPAAQQAMGAGAAQVARGPLQAAAEGMAANPGMQIAGAAGTGLGAGIAREEGGGTVAQIVAGLAGGMSAAGLTQAARSVGQAAKRLVPVRHRVVDQRIDEALKQAGVNWSEVPEQVRRLVREDAAQALKTGDDLNADALSRLVEFRRVGATPTRGTVSLDPVQITREQNLARMGANASDEGLHGLARVQNDNNRALIDNLNRLGADSADDAFAAGERAISGLQRGLDAQKANVDHLYSQARDSAGRSFPLDGHSFTTTASKLLDDNLLGGALPESVQSHLNRIAQGQVPFTVDYAQQLATAIGKLQRGTSDGQTRMALGLVRRALDDTPIMEMGQQGPAAGARMTGTTAPYAGGPELGQQAVDAFNKARLANKMMMRRIERIPGLKAVYEGNATPDDFVQKHVISSAAKGQDVQALASLLRSTDHQAHEAVRASIAQHLKQAAIGIASDEGGKFSASGFNRALFRLRAQRKLKAFFSPEEIEQLQAVGRVSHYTTAQPAGSAVNNSNSGTFLMGRGLDLLDRLSSKLPLFNIGTTVSGGIRSVQQRQAQNVGAALARRPQPQTGNPPAITFGTLQNAGAE
ncbi:hypothetical protein [Hydrogenophaga sp. NFH-34]|uniref:hypothetical protein n=1 Tax=Hydrogenophaga sp. NFH-34 TaxID=2744446 RepID=UPI001F485D60|nr:hypothetical protein [Hydrogenophaga sp. NFH-34]